MHTPTTTRARTLRAHLTEAERLLWQHLRGRQIENCKFRRQHPVGRYITDFACLSRQLLIELDGGQHAESAGYDRRRDAYLQQQGFRVIRYWNHQVLRETDEVLEDIRRHLLDLA